MHALRLKVGVISDSAFQRHAVQQTLRENGVEVVINRSPQLLDVQRQQNLPDVACWIIDLEDENFDIEALLSILEGWPAPVLFGLGLAPDNSDVAFQVWQRRLLQKLATQFSDLRAQTASDQLKDNAAASLTKQPIQEDNTQIVDKAVAHEVWVLAASLGGPAAVKEFLDELPASISAGLLYAQHVDAHFSNVLLSVLGRHAALKLRPAQQYRPVYESEVLMVPVDREINVGPSGVLIMDHAWPGPYGPSIETLLQNLFAHYGKCCHVVVFSGMGNDGVKMLGRMADAGCKIWAQKPSSCANDAMPRAAIALDCCELIASPKELAKAFLTHTRGLDKSVSNENKRFDD